ncbi:diguanylate cyclase [Deinococcus sp. AJ005]|uniref:tetratricopeptide repeat-containing diguanylate cyclase n=1 Tax=Deinococcus sp. AJ005 TaxID=2652443 RepID=UPI00125CCF2A|nr:diguanylate cyclase [Deinococcus sp. AJ005]QFP77138.1 diguanylate cyclase [Deinococcus sp. AJ005]
MTSDPPHFTPAPASPPGQKPSSSTSALERAWQLRDTQPQTARQVVQDVLGAQEQRAELAELIQAQIVLGYLDYRLGDSENAVELMIVALSECRRLPADVWLARALNNLACVYSYLNQTDLSIQLFDEQLRLAQQLGDQEQILIARHDLGVIYLEMSPQRAKVHFLAALDICLGLSPVNTLFAAALYSDLMMVSFKQNNDANAQKYLELMLQYSHKLDFSSHYVNIHGDIVEFYTRRGNYMAAERELASLKKAIAANQTVDSQSYNYEEELACISGPLYLKLGKTHEAIALLESALENAGGSLHIIYELLSRAYELTENLHSALKYQRLLTERVREHHKEESENQFKMFEVIHRTQIFAESAQQQRIANEKLQRLNDQIYQMGITDALTGLANRHHLLRQSQLMVQKTTDQCPLAIALIDIDHFKRINDRYGHAQGDQVIAHVAQQIRAVCWPDDLVARYGGEEFVVMRLGATESELAQTCEALRTALRTTPSELPSVTVSAGVAQTTTGELDATMHLADQRLYAVKQAGRDQVFTSRHVQTETSPS